jgi:Zn finger protein HypA/HybF involved in hydrogenase expression
MTFEDQPKEIEQEEMEALCRECGHGFKVFVDRLLGQNGQQSEMAPTITCPVCGCNECPIVHKGSS